jgi:hypothetical protein
LYAVFKKNAICPMRSKIKGDKDQNAKDQVAEKKHFDPLSKGAPEIIIPGGDHNPPGGDHNTERKT